MKLIVFALVVLSVCSCNQDQKFDKSAWRERGDLGIYPYRKKMLKELMNKHQLKGLTYKQLIEMLGKPEDFFYSEPNTAYYNIEVDYGRDIDPVYIKNLEIKYSSDSIVTDININEIKH